MFLSARFVLNTHNQVIELSAHRNSPCASSYLWVLSGSPSASLLGSALLFSRDGALVLGSLAHDLLLAEKKIQRQTD